MTSQIHFPVKIRSMPYQCCVILVCCHFGMNNYFLDTWLQNDILRIDHKRQTHAGDLIVFSDLVPTNFHFCYTNLQVAVPSIFVVIPTLQLPIWVSQILRQWCVLLATAISFEEFCLFRKQWCYYFIMLGSFLILNSTIWRCFHSSLLAFKM